MPLVRAWNDIFPHWGHRIRLPQALESFVGSRPLGARDTLFAEQVESEKKIELHVHMEAAVGEAYYESLNEARGLYARHEMPAARAPFLQFSDFIKAWIDNTKLIDDESMYSAMAREFAKSRAAQNILYSEVHVSPIDFTLMRERFGFAPPLDLEKCMRAILRGVKDAEREHPEVAIRLIVDCLWIARDEERAKFLRLFHNILNSDENRTRFGTRFVVGVGLGGPEVNSGESDIAGFLRQCRELGLRVDIHSGEMVDGEEHKRNTAEMTPDRVAHGIAAASEDWFFDGHISACPLSNVLTGSFKGPLSEHPIEKMRNMGLSFSVNSDDPLLFSTTLTLEYVALFNAFGWGMSFFKESQQMARAAAFDRVTVDALFK